MGERKMIEVRIGIDIEVQGISSTTLGLSGTEAGLRQIEKMVEDGWTLNGVSSAYDDVMRVVTYQFRFIRG